MKSYYSNLDRIIEKMLFSGLLILIVAVPLPFGSQRNWAIAFWFLFVTSMLCIKLIQLTVNDRGYSGLWRVRWPLGLLLGYAGLICLQIFPVGLASSQTTDRFYWPHITQDLHQTRLWLMLTLTYAGMVALMALILQTSKRVTIFLYAIVVSGAFQALLAIALVSTRHQSGIFYFNLTHDAAMGSFSGRNLFAGYMELALSVGIGLLVAGMARSRLLTTPGFGWVAGMNTFFEFLLSRKMIVRGVLIVMVIALVLSRSRMGNAAFFASLLVAGALVGFLRTEFRRVATILVASMILIDLLVVGDLVGLDKVVDRISETTMAKVDVSHGSIEDRVMTSRQALPMIRNRPLLGYGAGAFYTSFPPYQQSNLMGFWDHPHNDFMEIAVDTGLLGLGLLVFLCLLAAWRALQALRGPFDELRFAAGLACILALTCMGIHGMVDFVLQIPANAMLLCSILATVFVIDEA